MSSAEQKLADRLPATVAGTIDEHRLLAGGEKVLVAVSGGADSLCLLHLLWRQRERYSLSLAVAHVNHLMRPEAAEDACFVVEFAQSLGLNCEVVEIDVRALAQERKLSLEDAGRQARYQALIEIAGRMGAQCIALGHTADDQVETILLNFLRGGGSEGLAGMPVSREVSAGLRIVRPLIALTKAETEGYCREQGFAPRFDTTNQELFARRNRIRHQLLPALREEQPAIDRLLLRQAEIFRAEDEFMRGLAEKALKEAQLPPTVREPFSPYGENERSADEIVLAVDKLQALPLAPARRLVREALRKLRKGRLPLALEQVERVLQLACHGDTGKRLSLGDGLWAIKEYDKLTLCRGDSRECACSSASREEVCGVLAVPGGVEFGGRRLRAERLPRSAIADLHLEASTVALLDAAKLADCTPLRVCTPRPGDRFVPLGGPGQMKLQDFFVNLKLPRRERAQTLLVCCGQEIAWVVGYRIDERFKVTPETKEIVRIELLDNLA